MRNLLLFVVFLCASSFYAFAQERIVTGKITDGGDDFGLPGVNVIIKGTSSGTVSDFDGNYSISIPNESATVLVYSFIGMETKEEVVGARSVIDIALGSDTQQLSEVIVTAQGIERNKEALGFAVSSLSQDAIADKSEGDLLRSMRSKASGVQITQQSGLSGSGNNIIIRGYTSMTGSNQPLFVVDGVPIDNSNNSASGGATADGFSRGESTGSSRSLDIDPNNIADIKILKGLAASTLYGTQGRNGVILITTKTAQGGGTKGKMDVTVSQSLFANEIASLPDYQNSYGGGFDQSFGWYFSNWGPGFFKEGLAGWGADLPVAGTFWLHGGDRASSPINNGQYGILKHPYSQWRNAALRSGFPQYQEFGSEHQYTYKPYENVKSFFRTGLVATTSVSAQGTSKDGNSSYGASFGYTNDQGFTPGNNLERINLSVGGRSKLSNGVSIRGTMNLVRTDYITPPISASDGNGSIQPATGNASSSIFGDLFFTPRSVDMINLPYEHPDTKQSVYYRNGNDIQHPLWTLNNAYNKQLTHRIYGNVGLSYNITDELMVGYRLGYDIYSEDNEVAQNKGGIDGDPTGLYRTFTNLNTIWDNTAYVSGNYKFGERFTLGFDLGFTSRSTTYSRQGLTSTNQLIYGVLRHFNFTNSAFTQFYEKQNILGIYGQIDAGYQGYLFLTFAVRNDWVSNFPVATRSQFYPSVSASALLSEIFPVITTPNGLNFLKLRVGYGTSAGFRGGYPTASLLTVNARDFLSNSGTVYPSMTQGTALGNPNLKPELQSEVEVGIESRVWRNRISLDLSWYWRTTTNLIINRPLDPATGYASVFDNLGEVRNTGVEIDLGVDVIKTNRVTWNVGANFTLNRNTVIDIGNNENINIAGFTDLGNFAVKGEPLGVMMGSTVSRVPSGPYQGQYIISSSTGEYLEQTDLQKIGDPNPDFTMNVNTSVSYRNFTLAAVFNWVNGGDILSYTIGTLLGRGLTTDTENRKQTFVTPGVVQQGSGADVTYVPANIQINNSDFYFADLFGGPDELLVYDATTIRLQELSLSYTLPKSILAQTPFGSVSLTASAYNLWYQAVNTPPGINFDPNVAGLGVGNGQGFDYLNGPSSKRYGATLKFTF